MKRSYLGEIDTGVNIVERQYEKQILTKSSAIETHKFRVYGRKHPLKNIRRNLLKKALQVHATKQ